MTTRPHTIQAYDDSMRELAALIAKMGESVTVELNNAMEAMVQRDDSLAQVVRKQDKGLNKLEMRVDALVVEMVALRQPMAGDLRYLMSTLRIAGILERVGDYAKQTAKRTLVLNKFPPFEGAKGVISMGRKVEVALQQVLEAFRQNDLPRAIEIWEQDADIDELYTRCFQECLETMFADKSKVGVGTHTIFIAKHLERIGDFACNIAEQHHYYVKGEPLGYKREKRDRSLEVLIEMDREYHERHGH